MGEGWTVVQHFPNQPSVLIKHRDGRLRTVHLNRLRLHVVQPSPPSAPATPPSAEWEAPSFEHHIFEDDNYMPIGPPTPAPTRPVVHEDLQTSSPPMYHRSGRALKRRGLCKRLICIHCNYYYYSLLLS